MPDRIERTVIESPCVKFRLGDRGFGLPLAEVREIAPADTVAPVPLAPGVVRGIAALRGQVITLLDVAAIFGLPLPPIRSAEDRLMLVLDGPYSHLGLYVHAPVEIARAAAGRRAPISATAPLVMVASAQGPGPAGSGSPRGARGRRGGATAAMDPPGANDPSPIVHLVSAGELVAYCDARVLECFRRKT